MLRKWLIGARTAPSPSPLLHDSREADNVEDADIIVCCHTEIAQTPPSRQIGLIDWIEWLFNVTINDISVIYVTAHRCAGGLKKKLSGSHAIDISQGSLTCPS